MENNNKLLNGVIHEGKPHIIELVDTKFKSCWEYKKKRHKFKSCWEYKIHIR